MKGSVMDKEDMNMMFSERLAALRKVNGYTQSDVANMLDVSFQAVSLWERGETNPEIDKLAALAELFGVSVDYLWTGKMEANAMIDFQDSLSDRLFDENKMYTYVKTYASANGLTQTMKVLPYARELHDGQVRKGKDKVPYIYHPLLIACHALSLGLTDDNLVSAALLHDVCEDCAVAPEDLPVNDTTKEAVALLTKQEDVPKQLYYERIAKHPIATMVKLLDRCNNVSGMAAGFTKERMASYIKETEDVVYTLLKTAKREYPMYSNQLFVIKYHMLSVVETIKRLG